MDMILRLPEVKAVTGLSRSSIYNAIKEGTFPERVSIGIRAVGWRASDINVWVSNRSTLKSATYVQKNIARRRR